jgi:urea transport system permease protein
VEKRADGSFAEPDARVRAAAATALGAIEQHELFVRIARDLIYGLSLGSVLLLAALGLAITFGLMGVINMAHGEMLMLGAYATYVVQRVFETRMPGAIDYYLPAALPVAFLACACVGMLLERSVIRFLYGRPLETLLATWGISLALIQLVRLVFGAANVTVANPSWLSGGAELMAGVVVPYTRLTTIVFVAVVVACLWYVLNRTTLGLQVRAITQNRRMARCVGIRTARVDTLTFGIGSGVAGLGGVALSQIGNVGPELGQSYIVDSFMVVVVGGVGSLFGTIFAALGLGAVNKLLEPVSGAVLGKILVLGFIILFIQRRPQGLFALKGRAAET